MKIPGQPGDKLAGKLYLNSVFQAPLHGEQGQVIEQVHI